MKQVQRKPRAVRIAQAVILFCCLILFAAGVIMLSIGKSYEAAAAGGGLAVIGLFLWLTRKQAAGSYLPIFQAMIVGMGCEAVLFGTILDWYDTTRFFDKLNHGLAGAVLAVIGLVVFYGINPRQRGPLTVRPSFVAMWCVAFAITIKVFWEFYEFAGDRLIQANMQRWQFGAVHALTDTTMDLVSGLVGSLLVSLPILRLLKKDSSGFYRRYLAGLYEHEPRP